MNSKEKDIKELPEAEVEESPVLTPEQLVEELKTEIEDHKER